MQDLLALLPSDFSVAFPAKLLAFLALVSFSYIVCILAPMLWSGFVALRQRPLLPRRVLFVSTVTVISYGVWGFVGWALELPISAYLIYIAPQLERCCHFSGSFTRIGGFLAQYFWLGMGPALLITSFVVTRYLARRWERIVDALRG